MPLDFTPINCPMLATECPEAPEPKSLLKPCKKEPSRKPDAMFRFYDLGFWNIPIRNGSEATKKEPCKESCHEAKAALKAKGGDSTATLSVGASVSGIRNTTRQGSAAIPKHQNCPQTLPSKTEVTVSTGRAERGLIIQASE